MTGLNPVPEEFKGPRLRDRGKTATKSSTVWLVTMFQLAVIFFPLFNIPLLFLKSDNIVELLRIAFIWLTFATLIGFMPKMTGSNYEMKKTRFKVWLLRFLRLGLIYSILLIIYGSYVLLNEGFGVFDYSYLLSHLTPYLIYLLYRRIITGDYWGRY